MYFEKTCLPLIDRLAQRSWSQRVKKLDKTWSVSYGLAHPDRTVPHRTEPHLSGSLVVRSWFALGSLVVLLRYGTVTVRYFFWPVLHVYTCKSLKVCWCLHIHIHVHVNAHTDTERMTRTSYCKYTYIHVHVHALPWELEMYAAIGNSLLSCAWRICIFHALTINH